MKLSKFVVEIANRVRDVPIEVNESMGTVSIGDYAFLQGEEGYEFIDKARAIWHACGDIGMDTAYAYVAEPFCYD